MAAEERLARQRWSIWPFKLCFFKRSFTFRRFLHSDKRQKKTRKWRMMNKSWPKYIYISVVTFVLNERFFRHERHLWWTWGCDVFTWGCSVKLGVQALENLSFLKIHWVTTHHQIIISIGGGFQYFLFSPPKIGVSWSNLTNIFRMGWFNHQPDILLEHMTYTNQLRI